MEDCGATSSALPLPQWGLHPLLLGAYTIYCTLLGLNQSRLACIQVLEDNDAVQGVAVVKRDTYNAQRCYIEHLWLDETCGHLTENGLFFISFLFATAHACGIPQMLAYLPHSEATAMALLKQSGFHQAMTRQHFLLGEEGLHPTHIKRSILLQAGWKRVSGESLQHITEFYNNQLPSLWRPALERSQAHFNAEAQHHGKFIERWWLEQTETKGICHLLLELVHPSSLSPWQINLFPNLNQDALDFKAHLNHIQAYCKAMAHQYPVVLCVWGYQIHLKHQVTEGYEHLTDKDVSLFIRDSKVKHQGGIHAKLPKGILNLEPSNSGGGHTSPA
jgi:hypothetical protein